MSYLSNTYAILANVKLKSPFNNEHFYICRFFTDEPIHIDYGSSPDKSIDYVSPRPSFFCSDLSFWRNKPCYNDTIYFSKDNEPLYTESRRCATYENTMLNIIEGNQTEKFSCNNTSTKYFCPKSKQCIDIDWLCDGSFQCKHGEDEDFALCKDTFPNNIATITCEENNRPNEYVTLIKAIPCNGIKECRDGSDENCELPFQTIWIILAIISIIMFSSWYYVHSMAMNDREKIICQQDDTILSREYTAKSKGAALACLKVCVF